MASIICTGCGARWNDGDSAAYRFSTISHPQGSYLTVSEIIATGEDLLTCPKGTDPQLEAATKGPGTQYHPEDRKMPPDGSKVPDGDANAVHRG